MKKTALILALCLVPCVAFGGVRRIDDPPSPHPDRIGSGNDLPVGCRFTPQQIEDWARTMMPAVQQAMREFDRRGYQRIAWADTAVNGCEYGLYESIATLAYRKPGALIDSTHSAWATIVVVTRVAPATGEPATVVSAGMLVVDANGRVFSADSLAQFANDRSFNVSTGPRRRGRMTESLGDEIRDPHSCLNNWARCAGWGTSACVLGYLLGGGPLGMTAKLAALVDAPATGLALVSFCFITVGIGCYGNC